MFEAVNSVMHTNLVMALRNLQEIQQKKCKFIVHMRIYYAQLSTMEKETKNIFLKKEATCIVVY